MLFEELLHLKDIYIKSINSKILLNVHIKVDYPQKLVIFYPENCKKVYELVCWNHNETKLNLIQIGAEAELTFTEINKLIITRNIIGIELSIELGKQVNGVDLAKYMLEKDYDV